MALGLLISALASTADQAVTVLPVVLLLELLLAMGGLFPDVVDKPVLKQLSYAASTQWSFSAAASSVDLGRMQALDTVGRDAPTIRLDDPISKFQSLATSLQEPSSWQPRAERLAQGRRRRRSDLGAGASRSGSRGQPPPARGLVMRVSLRALVAVGAALALAGCGPAVVRPPAVVDGGGAWNALIGTMPAVASTTSTNVCGIGSPVCISAVAAEMTRRYDLLLARCSHEAPFALMYLRVTQAVATQGARRFGNVQYLNHLDAAFANLYFTAYDNWRAGRRRRSCPRPGASRSSRPIAKPSPRSATSSWG